MEKKVGVLGASFDPPTKGHEAVINQAYPFFDEILLVPSVAHAFGKSLTPISQRLAMLNLFVKNWQQQVNLCHIEEKLHQQHPQHPVYTFEVLQFLENHYQATHTPVRLQFIIGPDIAEPTVWQRFFRFADIEKRWPLFKVPELSPIRSRLVRQLMASDIPAREKEKTLNEWVSPSIAHYILANRLYEGKS